MVMKPDVLARAIDAVPVHGRPRLLMSPRGKPLTQARAASLAHGPGVIIVCGRFEGVDERVIAARELEEVSLGDYVLSGGEVAALVLLDACVRLIPGVIGQPASVAEESFADGPPGISRSSRSRRCSKGRAIPDVLLPATTARSPLGGGPRRSAITRERRPDLWQAQWHGDQNSP